MLGRFLIAITFMFAPLASAEPLRVVTSIAPLQGLVADIMEGVGKPTLLLGEAVSAHDFAMRPSQAKAISGADIIFYVGQNMEPWLEKALKSRNKSGETIALGDIVTLARLDTRELDEFGEHRADHDDEGLYDPHFWLNPDNALVWLDSISSVLAIADPDNEDTYQANLKRTKQDIIQAIANIKRDLAPVSGLDLVVTHDSTQYFENAFDLNVIGAFSASDGQTAGARYLHRLLAKLGPNSCIVEDISHPNRFTASIPDSVNHVFIDPMGYGTLGVSGFYPKLLSNLAQSLLACRD